MKSCLIRKNILFLAVLLAFSGIGLWGAAYTWTGVSTGGDGTTWTNASNWTGGANYPGFNANAGNDTVVFVAANTPATVTIPGNITVTRITFDTSNLITVNFLNNALLTISDYLHIGSSTTGHPGVNVVMNGPGSINTSGFDTNQEQDNTLTLNNYINLTIQNALFANSTTNQTFINGDGTSTITTPPGGANITWGLPEFSVTNVAVVSAGNTLTVNPAPAVSTTITGTVTGTITQPMTYYATRTGGEVYHLQNSAGGNDTTIVYNTWTNFNFTDTGFRLVIPAVAAGNGIVFTVYQNDRFSRIGTVQFTSGECFWVGGQAPNTTSWNNPANWSTNAVPTAADDVRIPYTANQPVLNGVGAAQSILIQTGATLSLGGNTLTSATITVENGGALNVNTGVLDVTDLDVQGSGRLNAGTGTVEIANAGSWTCSQPLYSKFNDIVFLGSATVNSPIYVTRDWTDAGGLTVASAAYFEPTTTSVIAGSASFSNLRATSQGGKTITVNGAITANQLTLTGTSASSRLSLNGSGSITIPGALTSGRYVSVGPDIDILGFTYTAYSSLATGTAPAGWVLYASESGSPVTWTGGGGNPDWNNVNNWDALAVPTTGDEVVIPDIGPSTNYPVANVPVSVAELTVDSGATFDAAGKNVSVAGNITNNGTVRLTGTQTITGSVTNGAASTVEYYGGGTGTPVWSSSYQNLYIIGAATILQLDAVNVTVSGTLSNAGSIEVNGTGSIDTSDSSAGTFIYSTVGHTIPALDGYNNLSIPSGTQTLGAITNVQAVTVTSPGILAVDAFDMNAASVTGTGSVTATSGVITVSGNFTPGAYTAGSGTVVFGPATTPVDAGPFAYNILTVNKGLAARTVNLASGASASVVTVTSGTLAMGGDVTVSGDITIAANGRLVTGANDLSCNDLVQTGAGALLNALAQTAVNTIDFSGSATFQTAGFSWGAGTLVSSGTGNLTSAGNNLGNLVKTTGGMLTLSDTLDLNGNLTISAGTLNASGFNITLAGNWTNGDTFTSGGGTQTVTFDGTGAQSIFSGGISFNNVTVNKGGGTIAHNAVAINLAGNFSHTGGTFTQGVGVITLNGATNTISAPFTKDGSGSIIFSRTGAQSLSANSRDLGNVTVTGAGTILTLGTQTVTFDDVTISVNGRLSLDGSTGTVTVNVNAGNNISLLTGGTLHLASSTNLLTVAGSGGTANFTGAPITFNGQDLTLTSILFGPDLTLAANEDLRLGDGNCTFTNIDVGAGTFNANGQAWSMSGSWENAGTGSITNTGGTATLTGAAQTINAGGTGAGKPFGPLSITGTYALDTSDFQCASLTGTGSLATGDQNLTVTGDITTIGIGAAAAGNAETITVGGSFTPGSFTAENSTVIFNLVSTPVTAGNLAYNNLTLEKGAVGNIVNINNGASVGGSVSITQGTLNLIGTLTVTGGMTINANGTLRSLVASTLSAASITNSGTITINTATPTSWGVSGNFASTGAVSNDVAYTISVGGNLSVSGTFDVTPLPTFTMSGATSTINTGVQIGHLSTTATANVTAITSELRLAGNLTLGANTSLDLSTLGATIAGNATGTAPSILDGGSAAVNITGNFSVPVYDATSATTSITGTTVTFADLTHNDGTISLNGTGTPVALTTNTQIFNDLTLSSTGAKTVNVTGALTLDVPAGPTTGILTVGTNVNLNVGNNVLNVGGTTGNTGTITLGNQTATFTGLVTSNGATLAGGTGTLNLNGGLSATGNAVITLSTNTTNCGGDLTFATTTTVTHAGTLVFNGSVTPVTFTTGNKTLQNMSMTGVLKTVRLSGNLTVSGNLELSASQTLNLSALNGGANGFTVTGTTNAVQTNNGSIVAGSGALDFTGNFEVNSLTASSTNSTFRGNVILHTFSANGGIVVIAGTGNQSIDPNGVTFANISVTKTGGIASITDSFTVSSWNQSGGGGTVQQTAGTFTLSGTSESFQISAGTMDFADATIFAGGDTDASFTVSGTGHVTVGTGAFAVGAMTVSSTAAPDAFRQTGTNAVLFNQNARSLTVALGSTCVWDSLANGGSLQITNNVTANGTLSFNNKNVSIGGTLTGNIEVYDLVIPASTSLTPATGTTLTVRRSISIANTGNYVITNSPTLVWGGANSAAFGTYTDGNATPVNLGTLQITGAQTKTLSTHLRSGTLSVTTPATLATAAQSLTVNGALSGSGTLTATGSQTIDVGGNLSLSTVNLTGSTVSLQVGGNMSTPVANFTRGNSTVVFDGPDPGTYTLLGYTFYNLTMNLGASTTFLQPSAGITVTNTFTLTRGDFQAGNLIHNIAGDWNSSGANVTWNATSAGSSTINLTSPTAITVKASGADRFNNLTIPNANTPTVTGPLHVLGNLTVTNASGSITLPDANCVVEGNLAGSGSLIASAIASGRSLDINGDAAIAGLSSGNALTVAGDWTVTNFTHSSGTVTLDGTAGQTVYINGQNFYNLAVGTRSAGNTVIFNGALNVTNATVGFTATAGAYDIEVNNGGTVANNITFSNTGTLRINTTNLQTFTATGGLTATAPSNVTVAGTIATTNNNLSLGFYAATPRPVVLDQNTIITTGAGTPGNITLGPVDGGSTARTLELNAGTGNVQANGELGNVNRLASLTLTNATNATFARGIRTTGNISLNNSGVLTLSDPDGTPDIANVNISTTTGNFNQTGSSRVDIAADFSIVGTTDFVRPVELIGNVASALTGNATFGALSTINDNNDGTPYSLSFTGNGTRGFGAAIGATTPIGNLTLSGNGTKTFTSSVALNSTSGTLTVDGTTGLVRFQSTLNAASISQTNGANPVQFDGNVTLSGGTSSLLGNITFDGMQFSSADNVQFGTGPVTDADSITLSGGDVTLTGNGEYTVYSTVTGAQNLILSGGSQAGPAGTKTFFRTIGTPVALTAISQTNASGPVTFNGNVNTGELTTEGNVTFGAITVTASGAAQIGTNPAGTDTATLTGSATFAGNGTYALYAPLTGNFNLTLNGNGTKAFNGAVGGTDATTAIGTGTGYAITQNGSGAVSFNNTLRTASGINQAVGAGSVTFANNVTLAAGSFGSTFNENVTFNTTGGNRLFTSARAVTFGSAATDTVTLSGTNTQTLRTTGAALDGRITFNSQVSGPSSLGIDNADLLLLNEDADIVLSGSGAFSQTGAGLNQLAGGVTTDGGAISFASETWLWGTTGTLSLSRTSAVNPITFASNLHIAAPGKTLTLASPITVTGSLALYAGTVDFADAATRTGLTVGGDLVLLNGIPATMNIDSDNLHPDDIESGVAGLFAYIHSARGSATAATALTILAPTYPDASAMPASYSGAVTGANLSGKTITVDGNFYANGVSMLAPASWTLSIPANDSALASFAEAYNLNVANCTVSVNGAGTHAWVSAAETVTDALGNTGWAFSRPFLRGPNDALATGTALSGTYTVYDDVIRVEFRDSGGAARRIENSNNEISAALAYIMFNSGVDAFAGSFTDPECTIPTNGAGDLSVFYLRTNQAVDSQRWNTDATGSSPGDPESTDRGRPGVAPAHRTTVPNIQIPKALVGVYQTLRDEYKNRINHYYPDAPATRYNLTGDRTSPVLVAVHTGQELHGTVPATQLPYDAHNFLEFVWSEPVYIGGFDSETPATGFTIPYTRAQTAFSMATDWGGAITQSVPALTVAGYATIASGTLVTGSRTYADPTPAGYTEGDTTVHGLYRTFSVDGAAAAALQWHRLRISIAGWAEYNATYQWFYPGFIDNSVTPSGAVTVPANAFIRDRATRPNTLEPTAAPYDKASITVTNYAVPDDLYSLWDTTKPALAGLKTVANTWDDDLEAFEAVPMAAASGLINRLELHFFDNSVQYDGTDSWRWRSKGGWYPESVPTPATGDYVDEAPEAFGGARPYDPSPVTVRTSGGIRDSSLHNAQTAFSLRNGSTIAPGASLTGFSTAVNSLFYNLTSTLNRIDDPYATLTIDDSIIEWPIATAQIALRYTAHSVATPTNGFITDLAGNLLETITDYVAAIDKTPPRVTMSLAGAGRTDLFVLFSKNITIGNTTADGIRLTLPNPAAPPTILTPSSIVSHGSGAQGFIFTLPSAPTVVQLIDPASQISFVSAGPAINPETGTEFTEYADAFGNYVSLTETHRLTDIAIGLVDVLYAQDGVNTDGVIGSGEGALRAFDGSGRLLDRNITVGTRLTTGESSPSPLTMFYDANPPSEVGPVFFNSALGFSNSLWLPSILPGFNRQANAQARSLAPETILDANRTLRNFIIPEADPEMLPGSDIQFLFKYGDLFAARLSDPAVITSVAPWSFSISETKRQRGGVTILNNVIDAHKKEKVILQVEVPKAGNIVIQVFTLDGNLVKVLERGRKGGGTYTYYWDGSNVAGNPVARGMYFIRVVGPEMDEIRKVMVVKE